MKAKQKKAQAPLKFTVKNLGSVKKGTFTQKPLTVFCGPNNSGKTWAMYALHAFHSLSKGRKPMSLKKLNTVLDNSLDAYFNVPDELLDGVTFHCNCPGAQWSEYTKNHASSNVLLMPAERNDLHLLFRELKAITQRYAQPITDYMDWLNALTDSRRKASRSAFHKEATLLQKELAQGTYHLNRRTGDIGYKPSGKRGMTTHTIDLHATSGIVKGLFGLWLYLECQAKAGDTLMIAEPELNIHPSNQIPMAHMLARLANAGINIVISTHSDYIVREFNNLIMLSEDSTGRLRKELGYQEAAILQPEQVCAYLFDNNTIEEFKYTKGQGIAVTTFDEVIETQNESNNEIYHGLQQ